MTEEGTSKTAKESLVRGRSVIASEEGGIQRASVEKDQAPGASRKTGCYRAWNIPRHPKMGRISIGEEKGHQNVGRKRGRGGDVGEANGGGAGGSRRRWTSTHQQTARWPTVHGKKDEHAKFQQVAHSDIQLLPTRNEIGNSKVAALSRFSPLSLLSLSESYL